MPNVAADNLTLNEATDDPPADAATQKRAHIVMKGLQSGYRLIIHGLMQRGQNTVLMMKLMLTGVVCALECILMMQEGCWCSRWIHEDCIDDDNIDIEQCVYVSLCVGRLKGKAGIQCDVRIPESKDTSSCTLGKYSLILTYNNLQVMLFFI